MARSTLSRRQLLASLSALGACSAWPSLGHAQASGRIVVMTFPGTWERAARAVLLPSFKKVSPADVTISPAIIVEAVAKLTASRAAPPYDVIMLDEPAEITARAQGLLDPLPADKMPNLAKLPKSLLGKDGFGAMAAMQVFGIAYNPKTVKTAPKSWEELWRPEYKGRVLINGPDTTIGLTWMVNLAKMYGGSETNLEPAWAAMDRLRPNLATIPANPGAVGPLFQQGQADIAVGFLSVVEPLRQRGVDVAIAKPETGWGIVSNIAHVVKGCANPEGAAAYINTMLDTQVQSQLAQEPYFNVPSNNEVPFSGPLTSVAANLDELVKSRNIDWAPLASQRRDLIDRFNREFRRR